jgi:LEA14-like dessication related protein
MLTHWFLIIGIGLLAACVNNPIIDVMKTLSPKVTVADFRILNMGLLEQNYMLQLRIKNPNSFSLPIAGLNYRLDINEQEFASGTSNEAITIPATGEKLLNLKFTSNLMRIVEKWTDWATIFEHNFKYRISGDMNLVTGVAPLPFEYKGEIPLVRGKTTP